MTHSSIRFENISFSYETAVDPLLRDFSARFDRGWTGVVGPNGSGKTTVLKLATGLLAPQTGRVSRPETMFYCRQRTDDPPPFWGEFISSMDGEAFRLKGLLGVEDQWLQRWRTLSHGERKRAQVAVALWSDPSVLVVDEPTNHLDTDAQHLVFTALMSFKGVGLLVSHDRNLLDDLCKQCLFLDPPEAVLRPGGYSRGVEQMRIEEESIKKQRNEAKKEYGRIKREAGNRRREASVANKKRSKKGLAKKDHDARSKIDAARITGKDGVAGKRLNQLSGRLEQSRQKLDAVKVKKTMRTGIWMPGGVSKKDVLFRLKAGRLLLGASRVLHHPSLHMKPDDRIAVTGPNGCGKSTMVGEIVRSLRLPAEQVVYLPQEMDAETAETVVEKTRRLPKTILGNMMTVVGRLGSNPDRLMKTASPSPGEVRKLLLALGIAKAPHLIIMDEPTNHLDLVSIECMEKALSDCPCGLFIVGHDRRFLSALTQIKWRINRDGEEKGVYHLSVEG